LFLNLQMLLFKLLVMAVVFKTSIQQQESQSPL